MREPFFLARDIDISLAWRELLARRIVSDIVIERGRQKHTLQLQDYPELAAVIDSIRGTLAGDRKALERQLAALRKQSDE